jgi:ADP-heptose:LPS heptosyltransferase
VVYNTAVYAPIKKKWPDARLTVVVEPPALDVVKYHPDVDEVLCFRKGTFWEQARFYFGLFQARYDIAIDMHEGPRGAMMCFLSQAQFRVGHKFAKRSFLYNVKLSFKDLQPQYPIDYQTALIRKMGVEIENPTPLIVIAESSRENARRLLAGQGIEEGEKYCIIHPGTRSLYDQWQFEKFARLAEIFFRDYGLKVVFSCGPGEEDQVQSATTQIQNTPFAFIQTGLQEFGAITQGAKFALCHNGGYMHLASALGTPVIALFGVVNPRVWKPLGERDIVIYKNIECSPCNQQTRKKECFSGDAECKRVISVEDVLASVDKILEGDPRLQG